MIKSIDLPNELATDHLAQQFAKCLSSPLLVTFKGEIGAGKTTFIRAMLRALGIRSAIKSPTFSLVESYQCPQWQLHHFDLYRIDEEEALEYIGFRDYFLDNSVCCIEWPERAGNYLTNVDICFTMTLAKEGRLVTIETGSLLGEKILMCLASKQ